VIEFKAGDLFTEQVDALVNSVNCVGIMGRGVALQFKKTFPANFKAYEEACRLGEVVPGRMFVFDTGQLTQPRYIINFPTKRHWRGESRIADIEQGLVALRGVIKDLEIQSVALPPLGSGLGGLDWTDVRARIRESLADLSGVKVIVYEPSADPDRERPVRNRKIPSLTPGRAALVGLMDRYLAGLMDPTVSLLEVHKLMYFMQEAGERLRLRYVAGAYGPYAENLRHVLNEVEGHFVAGYADGGDAPDKQLNLVPGAVAEVESYLRSQPTTTANLSRVAQLVEGFETPFGLELLATVHWVATREGANSEQAVVERTYAWNARKRMFSEDQLHLAWDVLLNQGWLHSMVG
jgi:O-acetyl-ADP-ribose deacetylase (regulator of RNase III)